MPSRSTKKNTKTTEKQHEWKLCEELVVSYPKMCPKLAKIRGFKPTFSIQPLVDNNCKLQFSDEKINEMQDERQNIDKPAED